MKKNINTLSVILIILLCAIVGVETFYLVVSSKEKCDKNDANTNVAETNDNDAGIVKETTENSYELYAENLKKARNNYKYSKYLDMTESGFHNQEESSDSFGSGFCYRARLLDDGALYVDLNDKFKQQYSMTEESYKIATGVLQFYILSDGNGGHQSIFAIKEDGTVTKIAFEFTEIVITDNYRNLTNIVNIIQGKTPGSWSPFFIDVNGNLFK